MSELTVKRAAVKPALQALFLVFRIGNERYALQAIEVVEVLPRLPLKPIAKAPAWVAGVFAHRGSVVPVIDLSALTFGAPAQARTSTRLVLVNYRPDETFKAHVLGLILEQATDTLRCNPADFQPYGLDNPPGALSRACSRRRARAAAMGPGRRPVERAGSRAAVPVTAAGSGAARGAPMSSDQRFFDFLKERIGLDVTSVGPAIIERAVRQRSMASQGADGR